MDSIELNEEEYVITANYDFRKMTMEEFLSIFDTKYMWSRENIINGENQYYLDPEKVEPEHNPFILSPTGLSIRAALTDVSLFDTAIGLDKAGRQLLKEGPLTEAQIDMHATFQGYTSGVITTRNKGHSQFYGYFEISAKLPEAAGAWPAFWTLPTFKDWGNRPSPLPEQDILEALKTIHDLRRGVYSVNVHTWDSGQLQSLSARGFTNDIETGADLVNEYHRYGQSWDEDFIVFFFDGIEVLRVETPEDMKEEPRHMLLNLAVGGSPSWREQPDPAHYPCSFDVEWMRVYEKQRPPVDIVLPPPLSKPDTPVVEDSDNQVPGDLLFILDDGRYVTRRDLSLITEYFIQLGRQVPFIENIGPKP